MKVKFNQILEQAEIAIIDAGVKGTNILLPYGTAIKSKLEQIALEKFRKSGYQAIELPQAIPSHYVEHLIKENLFNVKTKERDFYLAGSGEMTATLAAKTLINNYKHLPLKLMSVGKVFRENGTNALIKDVESGIYEFNSFFAEKDEAEMEIANTVSYFENAARELGIPTLTLKKNRELNSAIVVYTHFPFSDSFGTMFYAKNVEDKYAKQMKLEYQTSDNKKRSPTHVNAGFTTRIIPAYIAHHLDKIGLTLDFNTAPIQAVIIGEGAKSEQAQEELQRMGITYTIDPKGRQKGDYERYTRMGIPMIITPGKDDVKVFTRKDMAVKWIGSQDLEQVCNMLRSPYRSKKIPIKHITSTEFPYEPGTAYAVPQELEQQMKDKGYKQLGILGDESVFSLKKY